MKIIFLTVAYINSIEERGIYQDLMRKFRDEGHDVTVVCPVERRYNRPTKMFEKEGIRFLHVRTLNIQKTNSIEKGLSTLSIEMLYLRAVKKYLSNIYFDIVLYSTPPITLTSVIGYLKRKNNAYTYLLLKDIFPQNAVDMNMINKNGILYNYFRNKEKKIYQISDSIGCMSRANVDYIIKNNPRVNPEKMEVNPNSILPVEFQIISEEEKRQIKSKLGVPNNAKLFLYGGNLGKPQGTEVLLDMIDKYDKDSRVFFLIIGSGTEYSTISQWFSTHKPMNAKIISSLPKDQYDDIVRASDVGLIFLHKNFEIPNYPSRLTAYLEFGIPVLSITDRATDIGKDIEENNCGLWAYAGDFDEIVEKTEMMITMDSEMQKKLGKNGRAFLEKEFHIDRSYELITSKIKKRV